MTLTLSVPDHYGYVLAAGVGTAWLSFWQSFLVGKYRRLAKIPYPQGKLQSLQTIHGYIC
jgi:glutathione S-transferase